MRIPALLLAATVSTVSFAAGAIGPASASAATAAADRDTTRAPAEEATPPATPVLEVPEIVVSGNRVPESILTAPAAISVINKSRFVDTREIGLKDALQQVPGLFIQSRGGAQDVRVTIRGYGARGNGERSNSGNMRGIRILTDGIPISEPDGRTSLDLADLGGTDRIEVSRSNASALYGNASGGVINLQTDFDFDSPFAQFGGRGGSFGFHREQIRTGQTFNRSRGTLSLATSNFDGWRDHSKSAISAAQARLTTPLDDLTRMNLLLDLSSNFNRYPGPLTKAQADSAPEQANARFKARDERRNNKVGRVAVTLDHRFPAAHNLAMMVFVEPKALERSERNRFRDFNRYHLGGSAVWNWKGDDGRSMVPALSAGFDEAFQDGSILFYNLTPTGRRGTDLIANKREAANSAGAFLQGEATFNKRLLARIATRYDALHYVSEDRIEPQLNDAKTFHRLTPKASLSWLAGRHTIYMTLGGGVEAPAFNEIDPPAPFDTLTSLNPFLKTTFSTTYELGGRGRLERDLKYDAALYWIETRNDLVPYDGGAYFFTAGRTRRQGLELGADWLAAPAVSLAGALTLSRNRYTDYRNNDGDMSGNKVAGLPERVFSGTARYTSPGGYSAEAGADYVGPYFADDMNSAEVPDYVLFNARVALTRPLAGRSLHAFAACNNIADRRHIASAFINGLNGEYFEPGLPRNWAFGLTLWL